MTPQQRARYVRLGRDVADLKTTLRAMEKRGAPGGDICRCRAHRKPANASCCWSCVWELADENAAEETKEALRALPIR